MLTGKKWYDGMVVDHCARCGKRIRVARTDQHNYCWDCLPPKKHVGRVFVTGSPGETLRRFNKQVFQPSAEREEQDDA